MLPVKSSLRPILKKARLQLSTSVRQQKDQIITDRLLVSYDWSQMQSVLSYQSIVRIGEVDTEVLHRQIASRFPHLAITLAPINPDVSLPIDLTYDLIIVPMLGYDIYGHRLGLGRGWYDRLLARYPEALTVGLAYTEQQLPLVPTDPHDQSVQYIIAA